MVHDPTVDGEQSPLDQAPDSEVPDPEEPDPPRDPVALAAADVQAILAGALGLRRVVELAAESGMGAVETPRPDE